MRTREKSTDDPALPYMLFHPKFLWKTEGQRWESMQTSKELKKRWWKIGQSFAIDVDCRKFSLLDVVDLGPAWTLGNLLYWGGWEKYRQFKTRYVFSFEAQLTFEQARDEFVEYVCQHRWWSASYENEAQFRARNAAYTNMTDLMEPVSLKGKGPWNL